MRVLIIQQSFDKKNIYYSQITAALTQIFRQQQYAVAEIASLETASALPAVVYVLDIKEDQHVLQRLLFKNKLTQFIQKNAIDLVVQNGDSYVHQNKTPQLLIAGDTAMQFSIKKINNPHTRLITYANTASGILVEKGLNSRQIDLVYEAAEAAFEPVDWSKKQLIKMNHAEGKEFFFVNALNLAIEQTLQLLKVFSGFKKWQHSSMKLVLYVKNEAVWLTSLKEKLVTYKYRDDIVLLSNITVDEYATILAGAYGTVYLPVSDSDVLPLLQSMQCSVPCISFGSKAVKEYMQEAALLADEQNFEMLTEQMILLYKDENLRNELLDKCAIQSAVFSMKKQIAQLQSIIEKVKQ